MHFCRCVMELNQIYEYPLFVFFGWNMMVLASTLVTLQFQLVEYKFNNSYFTHTVNINLSQINFIFAFKWDDDLNLVATAPLLIVLDTMIAWVFLVCEPGARVTTQFELFEREMGELDWYLLSIEMRRMYMVFLSDTQQPKQLSSYGNIICERETPKKVLI